MHLRGLAMLGLAKRKRTSRPVGGSSWFEGIREALFSLDLYVSLHAADFQILKTFFSLFFPTAGIFDPGIHTFAHCQWFQNNYIIEHFIVLVVWVPSICGLHNLRLDHGTGRPIRWDVYVIHVPCPAPQLWFHICCDCDAMCIYGSRFVTSDYQSSSSK